MATRLVPVQPNEEEALRRGSMLTDLLFARLANDNSSDLGSSDGPGQPAPVFQVSYPSWQHARLSCCGVVCKLPCLLQATVCRDDTISS